MILRRLTKLKILIKQNITAFIIIICWFFSNIIYFFIITSNVLESLLIVFYFRTHNSLYGNFYDTFSDFIIFGLVFSLITVELFRKYNPSITSREISKKQNDHVIIIGYTHIGQRLLEYFKAKKIKYVIIEENRELVDDLITNEEPVVNDTPMSEDTLLDAGISKAKAVYITSGDFEVQMVVNYNVRKLNPKCKLVARIFQDDIADLIAKNYNAEIISTSKYAANVIFERILKQNCKKILLIGLNHISHRLVRKIEKNGNMCYNIIEEDEEIIEDLMLDCVNIIQGDPKELSILQKANIEDIDCVVNTDPDVKNSILITKRIRDLNRDCKIISRFFLDSVAEILEKPPFRAEVISSSKKTLDLMIEKGMLNF